MLQRFRRPTKQTTLFDNSPKALAIATFPRTAITGTRTIDEPKSDTISLKVTVRFSRTVENGGSSTEGMPDRTGPKNKTRIFYE